jgi:hypothetical protein
MAGGYEKIAGTKRHSGGDTPGERYMKHTELIAFLKDLMPLLQEKYNNTLGPRREGENEADYQFRNGQNFAYYDTLDLIHSQLLAFGIPAKELEPVVPSFGLAYPPECLNT